MQVVIAELETGEFVLEGHAVHTIASTAATAAEYVPAPQSVHGALPIVSLYFPAVQAVHVPPLGPVKPKLHLQSLSYVEYEFAGQFKHAVEP